MRASLFQRRNHFLRVTFLFHSSVVFFIQREFIILTCIHVCRYEIISAVHIISNQPPFRPMALANQHKQHICVPLHTHIHSTTITTTKKSHPFPYPQPRCSSLVHFFFLIKYHLLHSNLGYISLIWLEFF